MSKIDTHELKAIARYRRAVDYLAADQIYLKGNPGWKSRRGWSISNSGFSAIGTPRRRLLLIYTHLNRLILKTEETGLS